ncbi:hypothetical protein LXL04_000727 [Taraxacum kok-saghyz]
MNVQIKEELKSLNTALDIITYCSPDQSVEGLKVLYHQLENASDDPKEGSLVDELVENADKLIFCLADKMANIFHFSLMDESSRSCKYVLNTLMQIFQIERFAKAVSEKTLAHLISKLLIWLLDERDNAERTTSFVILISLLKPPNESCATGNINFSELVVKCLIKLTKVLESTIDKVNIDRILQSIHVYLEELGVEEIRRSYGNSYGVLPMECATEYIGYGIKSVAALQRK